MKVFIYIVIVLFAKVSFAQSDTASLQNRPEVFTVVEEMPEFPGGTSQMMKFIQINSIYPLSMKERGIGGKVFVKFIINELGEVKDIKVIKSSGSKVLDDEAKTMMSYMPKWNPGKQNGNPVSVYYNLPVSYGLAEPYFVFNSNNQNTDYLSARSNIEEWKYDDALEKLNKIPEQESLDVLYTKAVIYFRKKFIKASCSCFTKIDDLYGADTGLIINNAKKFKKDYCSN